MGVLALFVLPYFLLIAYFSYFNSDVVYLRGGGPPWMLNPEDQPVVNGFPMDFPATYRLEFSVGSPPVNGRLELNAVKAYVLSVNGTALTTEEETARLNWKSPQAYDITPYLIPGTNTISVYVRSPYSRTALKAKGEVVLQNGAKVSLDSGYHWSVTSLKPFPPLDITGGVPIQPDILVHESFLERLSRREYMPGGLSVLTVTLLFMLIIFLFPRLSRSLDKASAGLLPESLTGAKTATAFYKASIAIIFILLGYTLYHNFLSYPAVRTGDFDGHLEYLQHFLKTWRVPLANEGFQMYNPPAYYLASGMLYRLFGPQPGLPDVVRYAQALNSLSTFFTAVFIFLILKRVFKEKSVIALTLAVTAFLPVSLYKAPSVSPESAATLICTASFYFWLLYLGRPDMYRLLAVGLLTALGFLTRYTAVFPFLGICAGFAYAFYSEPNGRKRALRDFALYCVSVAAVSGWYYARNMAAFHQLFPMNLSPGLFFFRQVPGYRDWNFYTDLAALFMNNPLYKENIMGSFVAGGYATFWYDGQRLFATTRDHVLVFIALAMSLLPSVLIGWGTVRSARKLSAFSVACLVTIALSIPAFMLASLKYPNYSAIKSFYILYCLAPFMYFLAMGLSAFAGRHGRLIVSVWLLALCLINLRLFCS